MKIKKVDFTYKFKKLKDFKIGDSVIVPDGDKAEVISIQKNGVRNVYKITLSDGRTFKTSETHCSTVHFRNSHIRPDKKVYDVVPTKYIRDNLDKYLFEIPTDETFSLKELDFIQFLEMLPQHEYDPIDEEFIIPDLNRDPKKIYIEKIEQVEDDECWCLSLNDPLGMFLINDGIFTHNSLLSNLCVSYDMVLFCLMREPFRQLGHSQPVYEKVKLPDGKYTTIGDLKIGMEIAGVTQGVSKVIDIIEQGEKETYEITFEKGQKVRCSLDHLWTVFDSEEEKYKVMKTEEIFKDLERYLFPEEEDCKKDCLEILKAEEEFEKTNSFGENV